VAIVGAGPAGLLLGQLLHRHGIDTVILENRSREYVEARIRAGVLEQGTVEVLREAGVGERLDREGLRHGGIHLCFDGTLHRIAMDELTGGRAVTVYGQTEIVKDLIVARVAAGAPLHFECSDVAVDGLESDEPVVRYTLDGDEHELRCDYIAGCDGFHGICRPSIPDGVIDIWSREYPFGWLGILADVAPSSDELIYAYHDDGFALLSMRSPTLSRLYIQVDPGEDIADWSDDRIWEQLQVRLASDGFELAQGPVIEKGITPMRSFVAAPMRYRSLLLAGDACHIVPPTGAKGLNLAAADVTVLARALHSRLTDGSSVGLDEYSDRCLARVWRAQHFSWWMTTMLHLDPSDDAYGRRLRRSQLDYVTSSAAAATSLAENYVGLPLDRTAATPLPVAG
jgi:p-hydroxybenzoate 3-monooxygenase